MQSSGGMHTPPQAHRWWQPPRMVWRSPSRPPKLQGARCAPCSSLLHKPSMWKPSGSQLPWRPCAPSPRPPAALLPSSSTSPSEGGAQGVCAGPCKRGWACPSVLHRSPRPCILGLTAALLQPVAAWLPSVCAFAATRAAPAHQGQRDPHAAACIMPWLRRKPSKASSASRGGSGGTPRGLPVPWHHCGGVVYCVTSWYDCHEGGADECQLPATACRMCMWVLKLGGLRYCAAASSTLNQSQRDGGLCLGAHCLVVETWREVAVTNGDLIHFFVLSRVCRCGGQQGAVIALRFAPGGGTVGEGKGRGAHGTVR